VTGCRIGAVGLVTSLGHDLATTWRRLRACDPTSLIRREGLIGDRPLLVGQVPDPLPAVPRPLSHHACRNNALSLAALLRIDDEVRDALAHVPPARVAVVMGSSTAGIAAAEEAVAAFQHDGALTGEFHYAQLELGGVAEFVADQVGARGPCYTISTACSSGAKALASARSLLELGLCDVAIAGGTDSLCRTTAHGFSALKAISDVPSVPFSTNRAGFTLGEGSAICVLTRDPGGIQLAGAGESSDAHHMSAPQPDGAGAEVAMRAALADASLPADRIDYLNLHGTGTPLNDVMEGKAVHRVFGDRVPCSSTKPLVGHTLGASGAIEAAFCWLALRAMEDGRLPLPPHPWDGAADPEIPAIRLARPGDAATIGARAAVMSNSFGFGGNNCSLVLAATAR
jgi:3-oxoacyl-[acyl-carrier-protein] synthase-1